MGWICSVAANNTLDNIQKAVKAQGHQSSNVFDSGKRRYFFEVSRRDQADGGISGVINLYTDEMGNADINGEFARQTNRFKIDGRGRVLYGPKLFKDNQ